jgi:hypothetical protein
VPQPAFIFACVEAMAFGMAFEVTQQWGYRPETDPRLNDVSLMKRYAAEQLRREDSDDRRDYKIALEMLYDPGLATAAVARWNSDPVVIQERLRLQEEHGERAELPTKETVLKEVLGLARQSGYTMNERLNAYKLYSEMSGYTGRNSAAAPSVSVFANKVMYVRDQGSDDTWEARAAKQQAQLVADAKADSARNEQQDETRH